MNDIPVETCTVTPQEAGLRLDKRVAAMASVGSRRRAREAIESGKVDVDGHACGPEDIGRALAAGAVVTVTWNRPGTALPRMRALRELEQADLKILFEDAYILAIDKPPGLLTDVANKEQAENKDSLSARVDKYLHAQGDAFHAVHRIDRDTSGVVLVARNEEIQTRLRGQFRLHQPERVYWAAVHGVPFPAAGEWADWMSWDREVLRQRSVDPRARGAVLARAHYQVIRTFGPRASIVEVRLVTGRRNQIRLHLQIRRHPIIGEKLYLPEDWTDPLTASRQALHALRLGIVHPVTGRPIVFESPLPDDLATLVMRLETVPPYFERRRVLRASASNSDDDDDGDLDDDSFDSDDDGDDDSDDESDSSDAVGQPAGPSRVGGWVRAEGPQKAHRPGKGRQRR